MKIFDICETLSIIWLSPKHKCFKCPSFPVSSAIWDGGDISFICNWTLSRSSLLTSWIRMALIPTFFLHGMVQPVRLDGRIALNTKQLLSPPMMMTVFPTSERLCCQFEGATSCCIFVHLCCHSKDSQIGVYRFYSQNIWYKYMI